VFSFVVFIFEIQTKGAPNVYCVTDPAWMCVLWIYYIIKVLVSAIS